MIIHADARALPLRDGSVQCVVTSPPYWGLRDYGTATWEGGDAACDHLGEPFRTKAHINQNCGTGMDVKNGESRQPFGAHCRKCGAKRIDRQIGLEPTPEAYVASMVEVFREVWRVLKDDGVLWLNLGDSYHNVRTSRGGGVPTNTVHRGGKREGTEDFTRMNRAHRQNGLKEKDLVGIPWRVAFALQSDGWYLRQDIIWSKPNPMPESVTDRCTKAHEYLFLLTKSARYYWDAEAMREPANPANYRANASMRDVPPGQTRQGRLDTHRHEVSCNTRNRRSVWSIATKPYAGAHFATMPPDLVKPCILASTRPGDIVFDPFLGSGTVAEAAWTLGRKGIGTELNPAYHTLAKDRTTVTMRLPIMEDEAVV